jgi:hypothetical protein
MDTATPYFDNVNDLVADLLVRWVLPTMVDRSLCHQVVFGSDRRGSRYRAFFAEFDGLLMREVLVQVLGEKGRLQLV